MQVILKKYLETHKRIVVPQLGAFLVKETGTERSIVFSELLKRDDGVLRGVLCDAGRSELEADGMIERFVLEVRHAVENGAEYRLAGLGTLKTGPNGTITFAYRPKPASEPRTPAASEPRTPAASEPQETVAPAPRKATSPRPVVQPFPQPQPVRVPTGDMPRRSQINTERMAESVRTAFGSAAQPAESLAKKGVSPEKLYDDASYSETDEEDYVAPTASDRKFDRFVLVAILAALVAVAAIAFGFWHEARERQAENELFQLDEPYDTRFE